MKTFKSFFAALAIFLLASLLKINAQTYQFTWTNTFDGTGDGDIAYCLNHRFAGSYTYHVTFHVNPKTGVVDKQHNNVLHYDLTDLVTGEKLILIDTGNDGINYWGNWYFWDAVTGSGLVFPDTWYPLGGVQEGTIAAGAFKFISKGGTKVTMHLVLQLHMNANGEITADVERQYIDCN